MNLDRNSWMACAGRAALALALVLTAGCGDDGGGTVSDSDATTTAPNTSTNPTTTDPTTTDATAGEESSGSEGSSSDTGAIAVDYIADIQPIWDLRCVAGCHIETGSAQTNGPILTAEKSYADLVDAPSPTVPGIDEVEPGDTSKSYLWHKVNNTQASVAGLGLQMPLGGMLSADELATIEAWITAGAKP